MAEEEKNTEEQNEKIQENKEKDLNKILNITLKWVSVLVVVVSIIILSVYKSNNPDFSTGSFVFFIAGTLVLGALIWKGQDIYYFFTYGGKEKKGKDELPEPIDVQELIKKDGFVDKKLREEYFDYYNGAKEAAVRNVGRETLSSVGVVKLEPTPLAKLEDNPSYQYFIVNMHYPEKYHTYLEMGEFSEHKLSRAVNYCAIKPQELETIESEESKDEFGNPKRVTKHTKPKTKSSNKEKGDLS